MKYLVFILCVFISRATSDDNDPKVIIIGAGAAGIAVASRLMQNGINNITILEAENRHGGRIHSIRIGSYWADLGGQWVHGSEGNVAYELAEPFGLLSKSRNPGEPEEAPYEVTFYGSNGHQLAKNMTDDLVEFTTFITENMTGVEQLKTGSYGEFLRTSLHAWYEKHPEIPQNLRKPLLFGLELVRMAEYGTVDLDQLSAVLSKNTPPCPGYSEINWKHRAYSTILDILMKKYPNPEEELPILTNTKFNQKVTLINYSGDRPVEITTDNVHQYRADHVIFTPSLGVLQANHERLFYPSLPEKNKNAIEKLGMGKNAKIILYYENPWWSIKDPSFCTFFWTEEDKREIENDPQRSWMLGIIYGFVIEYKPKLYLLWLSGIYSEQMEHIPDEQLKIQTVGFLRRFLSNSYNITEPTEIHKSSWNTNENFRGTYSFPTLQSAATTGGADDLGEPVMHNDKPVIQFAGEATEPKYYSNVHGAISSGWREADRLINYYNKRNMWKILTDLQNGSA